VPENEDALGLEGLLSLDDVLGEVLSVMGNLSPHVVHEEWLTEVEFVVREGHGLEVEGHGGAALDITDLEAAGSGVTVSVEELGDVLAVLGEERVGSAFLPFLVEVHNVVGLWGEKTLELLVGEDLVENVNLIDSGLSTLISDASGSDHGGGDEVEFPERSVREHHEGEASVGDKRLGPHVVGAVEAGADLVEIVASAHSPFPVVSVHHVGHIVELRGISFGFGL